MGILGGREKGGSAPVPPHCAEGLWAHGVMGILGILGALGALCLSPLSQC